MCNSTDIASRNYPGYFLDDNDLEILLRALDHNRQQNKEPSLDHVFLAPCTSNSGSSISQLLPLTIDSANVFPRKFLTCYSISNIHWNVIEINQTSSDNVTCIAYNTDGMAYPVSDNLMQQIATCFQNANVTTITAPIQKYQFRAQSNNNCGIVCALIADDIRTGRLSHSNTTPLARYGNLLTSEMITKRQDRSCINELIRNHTSAHDIASFARPKSLYNQNGGQFSFSSYANNTLLPVPTGAQLDIYNQLQRQPETMLALYAIIKKHNSDISQMFDAICAKSQLKQDAKFLFADGDHTVSRELMLKAMGTEWIDTVIYAYNAYHHLPQTRLNQEHDDCARQDEQKNSQTSSIVAAVLFTLTLVALLPLGAIILITFFAALIALASMIMDYYENDFASFFSLHPYNTTKHHKNPTPSPHIRPTSAKAIPEATTKANEKPSMQRLKKEPSIVPLNSLDSIPKPAPQPSKHAAQAEKIHITDQGPQPQKKPSQRSSLPPRKSDSSANIQKRGAKNSCTSSDFVNKFMLALTIALAFTITFNYAGQSNNQPA